MEIQQGQDGLVWFEFSCLTAYSFLTHGIYSRLGGNSIPPYDSLNISFSCNDTAAAVHKNRDKIRHHMTYRNTPYKKKNIHFAAMQQVHGINTLVIESYEDIQKTSYIPYDALITALPNVALVIQHADCQPIFLVEPHRKIIAAIHAGWKGMAQNIIQHVISILVQKMHVCSNNIIATIGPSIGPNDYEFSSWQDCLPASMHRYVTIRSSSSAYLHLWEASQAELLRCGVQEHNIECSNMSTVAWQKYFFSYRRDKNTGRNASCIMLQKT